jgi:deazaflavin-dependent oxidoreductase (nitroreductase family)
VPDPETYKAPDVSLLGQEHVERYQATDGEEGYLWNGVPILLLTTTGRKTGLARTTPLIFGRDGDDYLVVASQGGAPTHPLWFLNLQADPSATIQVKADLIDVTGAAGPDEDQERLWAIVNSYWPNYDTYQSRTDRKIPVVVLRPTASVSQPT